MCMLHNETVNVWSHMLGSLGFILMLIYVAVFYRPADFFGTTSGLPMWPLFT